MMPFTDMTGLASSAIAMAAGAVMLSGVARIPAPYRIGLACAVAVVMLVPFGGLPLAAYVRAVTGDLSIASLVLLFGAILCPPCSGTSIGKLSTNSSRYPQGAGHGCKATEAGTATQEWEAWGGNGISVLLLLLALSAILFYPMALGLGTYDPYRLGYGNHWFLGALAIVAIATYMRQLWLPAAVVPMAVLAWTVGWYESTNLWDYLLDPFIAVYAIGALVRRGALTLAERR